MAAAGIALLSAVFILATRSVETAAGVESPDAFELLPSSELVLDQVDARPGNVLATVRNPHALAHVATALKAAGDRDVVLRRP